MCNIEEFRCRISFNASQINGSFAQFSSRHDKKETRNNETHREAGRGGGIGTNKYSSWSHIGNSL